MASNDDDDDSVVFLGTRPVRPAQNNRNKYSIDCDSSVGSNEVAIIGRKRSPFVAVPGVTDDPALRRKERQEKKKKRQRLREEEERKKQEADEENQPVEEEEEANQISFQFTRKTANEASTCAVQDSRVEVVDHVPLYCQEHRLRGRERPSSVVQRRETLKVPNPGRIDMGGVHGRMHQTTIDHFFGPAGNKNWKTNPIIGATTVIQEQPPTQAVTEPIQSTDTHSPFEHEEAEDAGPAQRESQHPQPLQNKNKLVQSSENGPLYQEEQQQSGGRRQKMHEMRVNETKHSVGLIVSRRNQVEPQSRQKGPEPMRPRENAPLDPVNLNQPTQDARSTTNPCFPPQNITLHQDSSHRRYRSDEDVDQSSSIVSSGSRTEGSAWSRADESSSRASSAEGSCTSVFDSSEKSKDNDHEEETEMASHQSGEEDDSIETTYDSDSDYEEASAPVRKKKRPSRRASKRRIDPPRKPGARTSDQCNSLQAVKAAQYSPSYTSKPQGSSFHADAVETVPKPDSKPAARADSKRVESVKNPPANMPEGMAKKVIQVIVIDDSDDDSDDAGAMKSYKPPPTAQSTLGLSSTGRHSPPTGRDKVESFGFPLIGLEEFVEKWEKAAFNISGLDSTQNIESLPSITRANNRLDRGCTSNQNKAQYGRLLPKATATMLTELLELEASDIFVDLGHGLGNAVMQAAYTHGCTSRGIELVKSRFAFSCGIQRELSEMVGYAPVELKNGGLDESKYRDFLTESGKRVMKVFCNNFGDVFGTRSATGAPPYLNDFVAGLFAFMKEGSKLVTFDALSFQVGPLDMVNKEREKFKMEMSPSASFYTMEQKELGLQNKCVTWSEGGGNQLKMKMYVYTRVGKESRFMCSAPMCHMKQNNTPQASYVINNKEQLLVRVCPCNHTMRPRRLGTSKANLEDN